MPYCDPCDRFLSPNTLVEDGTCPECGEEVAEPETKPRIPWHFWILVIALASYLGWRLIEALIWLAGTIL